MLSNSAQKPNPNNTSELSAEALALFREQTERPVFDVTQVSGELGSVLHRLQSAQPAEFIRSSHVAPFVGGGQDATDVGTALDLLADGYDRYIEFARDTIRETFDGITEPGGKLYPEMRSKACWRDLKSFTRVVGYTVATEGVGFSDKGWDTLARVYAQLDVPLDAVLVGVDAVRRIAVQDATAARLRSQQMQLRNGQQRIISHAPPSGSHAFSAQNLTGSAALLDRMFRLLLSRLKLLRSRSRQ